MTNLREKVIKLIKGQIMSECKKQHYVPKFYLRYFLFDENRFYLYNVEEDSDIGLVPYKDQYCEKYFYGDDLSWEKMLSKKENEWNKAILKTLENDTTQLESIKEFVLFQLVRTKAYNDHLKKANSRLFEETLTTKYANDIDGTMAKEVKVASDKNAEALAKPSASLNMIRNLLDVISDLDFVKIFYNTKRKIISSDNPILMIDPYMPIYAGLGTIGLILIFPINSNNLGVFYDSKIYDRFRNKQFVEIKNEAEVKKINALIYANSSKLIYSCSPIENNVFCFKNRRLRKNNIEQHNPDIFGTPTDKIVVTHNPVIQHDMAFSFSRIDPFFAKIGRDYRYNAQRKHSIEWQRKLFNRSQDFFVEAAWKNTDDFTIQRYKNGYMEFYKAMLEYWGIDE